VSVRPSALSRWRTSAVVRLVCCWARPGACSHRRWLPQGNVATAPGEKVFIGRRPVRNWTRRTISGLFLCIKLHLLLGKSTKTAATRAALFDSNMHQIVCRLGLPLRPHWGSLQRSPRLVGCIWGPTSKGRGGERERKGWEGVSSSFALVRKKRKVGVYACSRYRSMAGNWRRRSAAMRVASCGEPTDEAQHRLVVCVASEGYSAVAGMWRRSNAFCLHSWFLYEWSIVCLWPGDNFYVFCRAVELGFRKPSFLKVFIKTKQKTSTAQFRFLGILFCVI